MNKRQLRRRIQQALEDAKLDISAHASRGGKYAGALSGEGWTGGYKLCLSDVLGLLDDVEPSDRRGFLAN